MKNRIRLLFVILFLGGYGNVGWAQIRALKHGHAHNDYWHCKPLTQALKQGFTSVEADVHLRKGDLLVNHEKVFTHKARNLKKLYLKPLFERAKSNNFESVFTNGPNEFVLYIDVKEGCPGIHDTLISQLREFEPMLTTWTNGQKKVGAVSVIISDCGQQHKILAAEKRWFYFDAYLNAIGDSLGSAFIPRVNASLRSVTKWRGHGKMPIADEQKIISIVERAHNSGQTVRFWAGTNRKKVWQKLLELGVDYINVDRLRRFRKFSEQYQPYSKNSLP